MKKNYSKKIILASKSKIRAEILKKAGINFLIDSSNVDEDKIKNNFFKKTTKQLVLALAAAKALEISLKNQDAFVIGADQILECENIRFDKAKNFDEVKQNLLFLKGKKHKLINGLVVFKNGKILFNYSNTVKLTMRDFSEEFLDLYIKNNSEIINSVGCYCIESEGINLFKKIEGDYFSILGLPILKLLNFFRKNGVILS